VLHETKTIVVMADTHAESIDQLPEELRFAIDKADMVLHLGDFTSPEMLSELQKTGNFHGIWGNHDGEAIQSQLKKSEDVEIEGWKLGLIHRVFPLGSRLRLRHCFKGLNVDAILYGHSHVPVIERDKGIIYFNPGSVAGRFPAAFPSFGLMRVNGSVNCELVRLSPSKSLLQRVTSPIPRGLIRMTELWP
jgi:uncharacterized protein